MSTTEEERMDPTQSPTGLKAESFSGRRRLALIGKRIKRARESLGVTQGVLAHHVGVTQARVSRLETGANREFSVLLLCDVCAAVGADIRDVLSFDETEAPQISSTRPKSSRYVELLSDDELWSIAAAADRLESPIASTATGLAVAAREGKISRHSRGVYRSLERASMDRRAVMDRKAARAAKVAKASQGLDLGYDLDLGIDPNLNPVSVLEAVAWGGVMSARDVHNRTGLSEAYCGRRMKSLELRGVLAPAGPGIYMIGLGFDK